MLVIFTEFALRIHFSLNFFLQHYKSELGNPSDPCPTSESLNKLKYFMWIKAI